MAGAFCIEERSPATRAFPIHSPAVGRCTHSRGRTLIFHLCRVINIAAMVGVLCERTQIMECARTTLHSKHGFTPNTSTYLLTGESLRMKKTQKIYIFIYGTKKSNLDLDRLFSFVSNLKQSLTKTKKKLRQAPITIP